MSLKARRLFGLSIIVGVFGGIAGIILTFLVDFFSFIFLRLIGGFDLITAPGEPTFFDSITFSFSLNLLLPLLPILGALIVGYLIYKYSPETEGSGLDQIIGVFHAEKEDIKNRVPIVKMVASSITIGVGGSVGKEGPAGQIGGSIGAIIARKFKLTKSESRILLLTGAAACLGAVFKSPFGAAFFMIEVLYFRDYEVEAFINCISATFISYGVYCAFLGWSPLFMTPIYDFIPAELPLFLVLGLLCGGIAILFIKTFSILKNKLFKKLEIPSRFKPVIGMIFISLSLILFPYAVGTGYGFIQMTIDGLLPISIILILIVMKIFATSFTVTSGNSGGDFAPSLVIGGLIGGAFATGIQMFFPGLITQPGIFVIIGMGAFISGIANAPIAAIIMVSEMTNSLVLLAPALLASVAAYILSSKWSLFENQLPDRTYSLAHISGLICDVFSHITVKKIMTRKYDSIKINSTVKELEELARNSTQHVFPVVDDDGNILGVIGLRDIAGIAEDKKGEESIEKYTKTVFISILPYDNLKVAFHKLVTADLSIIPVIEESEPKKLLGMVTRKDIEKAMDL